MALNKPKSCSVLIRAFQSALEPWRSLMVSKRQHCPGTAAGSPSCQSLAFAFLSDCVGMATWLQLRAMASVHKPPSQHSGCPPEEPVIFCTVAVFHHSSWEEPLLAGMIWERAAMFAEPSSTAERQAPSVS